MTPPDPNPETEYFCPMCRTPHRSREDASIYAAHLSLCPRASVRVLPERYFANLEVSAR